MGKRKGGELYNRGKRQRGSRNRGVTLQRQPTVGGELDASAVTFEGKVLDDATRQAMDCRTMILQYSQTIASSSGGVMSSYLVNNISSAYDWTEFAEAFAEYRILGFRAEFFPWNRYSKTTTLTTPLVICIDRSGDTSAPVSYQQIMEYSSGKKKSLEDPWSMEWRMSSSEEAQFKPVTDVAPVVGLKLYADGLSASTTYGRFFYYWRIQFRNRK